MDKYGTAVGGANLRRMTFTRSPPACGGPTVRTRLRAWARMAAHMDPELLAILYETDITPVDEADIADIARDAGGGRRLARGTPGPPREVPPTPRPEARPVGSEPPGDTHRGGHCVPRGAGNRVAAQFRADNGAAEQCHHGGDGGRDQGNA
jgi:hypothetical protein